MKSLAASERWITHIANALGIRVEVEPRIELADGKNVQPWAHVKDFGAARGMLIFADWADYREHMNELLNAGYGVSSFREPLWSPTVDISSVKEMLCEWTWTGPSSLKPDWLE